MPAEKGKIIRIISAQPKLANTLYRYEVKLKTWTETTAISSVQKYEVGEEVLALYGTDLADQYNTPYLKKLKKVL